MINKLNILQALIQGMTGCEFILAGGCVRDTLHGVQPKDYDAVLCIGPDTTPDEVFYLCTIISERLNSLDWDSEVYQAYGLNEGEQIAEGDFRQTFLECIKTTRPNGDKIDLLFSRAPSIDKHVLLHDCNLNMVWLAPDTARGYGGPDLPAKEGLVFRSGICPERVQYITDKMKSLGY